MRSIRLRSSSAWISQESARIRQVGYCLSFHRRIQSAFDFRLVLFITVILCQNFFCHEEHGEFAAEKISKLPSGVQAMGDPNQMMNQQKMMMTGMVPQMVMMGIITYFFRLP
jgi:hypothetical protein